MFKMKRLVAVVSIALFVLSGVLLPAAASASTGSGVGTQSSSITLSARSAVLSATSISQIQTAVQSFLDQYGLSVSYTCPASNQTGGKTCTDLTVADIGPTKIFSAMLIEEYSKYPTALTLNRNFPDSTISLGDNVGTVLNGTPTYVAGVFDVANGGILYDVSSAPNEGSRETINHEFMHYLANATSGTGNGIDQTTWESFNPGGFTYSNYGSGCYEGDVSCSGTKSDGFATLYAESSYAEDLAETFAYLMTDQNDQTLETQIQTDTLMASKVGLMKSFLLGLAPSMDDSYLTAMHSYNQQYDGEANTLFGDTVVSGNDVSTNIPGNEDFSGLSLDAEIKGGGYYTLVIDGKLGDVYVSNGIIEGDGTVGALHVFSTGTVAPGHSPGCLNTGDLTLNGTYQVQIGGTTACSGYDQTKVTGTVDVTGATLTPSLYGGFVPSVGQSYEIISNDGTDPVTGTFANVTNGSITAGGVTYGVNYSGGDGNDVVLTVTNVDPSLYKSAPAAAAAPGAPDTGFGPLATSPAGILAFSTLCCMTLMGISYRLRQKPVSSRL